MKQTQTKLFNFSDVGLDFGPASKNLFPDRFKKMLSLGYNVQTVSSVTIAENKVTLTYGGVHGYAADRVLKVDSGALASINGGEFWIDSVTTNTVTFSLDDAPTSVTGGFTTRIASLGWSLEYEATYVHLYKMKHMDETDLYVRIVFQSTNNYRNRLGVCIGKSADLALGTITDTNTMNEYATATTVSGTFAWEFNIWNSATPNNQTAATNGYGKAFIIGSLYHFSALCHYESNVYQDRIVGILPWVNVGYNNPELDYPCLIGDSQGNAGGLGAGGLGAPTPYIGKQRMVCFTSAAATSFWGSLAFPNAPQNYLPAAIEPFNTMAAIPIALHIYENGGFVGYLRGLYLTTCAASLISGQTITNTPIETMDIDLNNKMFVNFMGYSTSQFISLITPVEEMKIV